MSDPEEFTNWTDKRETIETYHCNASAGTITITENSLGGDQQLTVVKFEGTSDFTFTVKGSFEIRELAEALARNQKVV